MVKAEDRVEFVGAIMDVIEDVLTENGISFPETKRAMIEDGELEADEEPEIVLYGQTYDMFADPITHVLQRWNVLETE